MYNCTCIPGSILITYAEVVPTTQISPCICQDRLHTLNMVQLDSSHQWGVPLIVPDVRLHPLVHYHQAHESG